MDEQQADQLVDILIDEVSSNTDILEQDASPQDKIEMALHHLLLEDKIIFNIKQLD